MNELRIKLMYQETLVLDDEDVRSVLTDLVDKATAGKAVQNKLENNCPVCNKQIAYADSYCWNCGQKLDWEE